MPSRKRKRDDEPEINEVNLILNDEQRADKEKDIWDAIRETHYEAIEQLPLTLHRQLSLMRQLDEQSVNHTNTLLPSLHEYIQYRQSIHNIAATQPVDKDKLSNQQQEEPLKTDIGANITLASPMKGSRLGDLQSSLARLGISPSPRKPPKANRELLSHVAWLSEELVRAAQEKVCLAQAANDSVERHIRLLDQAIKEQEAGLSMSSSNGTSLHLPDLVIPSRNRNARVRTVSDTQHVLIDLVGISSDIGEADKESQRMTKKGGKDYHEISGDQSGGSANLRKDSAALTITLPATQLSEELYCYCNRVSFGKMIACDNDSCEHEWFHLGCVGLMEIPKGKWFCEYCRVNDDL